MGTTIRVGSANVGGALQQALDVDWRLSDPAEVLDEVDRSFDVLAGIVHRAGEAGCDVLAFPEGMLGLMRWERTHPERLREVLPEAVARMLDRLGEAADASEMYLVCCTDSLEPDGALRNTAFFLGRDGREIGRYHKVALPLHEQHKRPGEGFPIWRR